MFALFLISGVLSVLSTNAAYAVCNDVAHITKTSQSKYKTITITTLMASAVIGIWFGQMLYSNPSGDEGVVIFNSIIAVVIGVVIGIAGHVVLKMKIKAAGAQEEKIKQQLKLLGRDEPIASNKTQLMAQFYELCQNKGYTNMRDDTQSLKAKVIASDLGLRYRNIVEFYEKAAQCYQQVQKEKTEEAEKLRIQEQKEQTEKARRAVEGTLLVTVSESKTTLKVYLRPDATTYCTVNDGGKIEGIPSVTVHKGGSLQYTYHPSETVFTGASSGGIMMGGTHQTEAYYSERVTKSEKGYIKISIGNTEFSVDWITMSDYTRERFKRDAQFKARVSNGQIRCFRDSAIASTLVQSAMMGGGDIYSKMSQLTMAADEHRLPYDTCKEIANLLGRVIHGRFPPTDAEIYAHAQKLADGETSKELLQAIETFRQITDYQDSAHQLDYVQQKYEKVLQAEKEQAILAREASNRRMGKGAVIAGAILAVIATVVLVISSISKGNAYRDAIALMEMGQYKEAIVAFEAMDGYKDSENMISECKYNEAIALMDAGQVEEAIAAFKALDGYKDSAERVISFLSEVLKSSEIGDTITFGAYEQDNNTSNGKEDVEWLVLDKTGDTLLLISRYVLDCQPYNTVRERITWETCSLRKWLNNTFINNAFTTAEQAMIAKTEVSAGENPEYGTYCGKDTQDQIFLLSIYEAEQYLTTDDAQKVTPTDYALDQSKNSGGEYKYYYYRVTECWLRSPGQNQSYAAYVSEYGNVFDTGNFVEDNHGVRPALWLSLES